MLNPENLFRCMGGRKAVIAAAITSALILGAVQAEAQLSGHNTKGDYGIQSGSQMPPGFYLSAPFYYRYNGESLRDRDGNSISIDPDEGGSLDANAYVMGLIWVSERKIFGGNYSFQIYPGFTDNTFEAPILGLTESVDTGLSDLYFQPVSLGWHRDCVDYSAGLGVTAPTGKYEADGSDNRGLGMWSYELFAGATYYFDQLKNWHFATTAFFEMHTEKEDSDVTVGNILTLEGGLGKSFKAGMWTVGAAYYAQWKLSDDDLGLEIQLPADQSLAKHKVYSVGPELTVPLATSKKLYGFLNARYLWEFGATTSLEGSTFVVSTTFPIPSIPLE